MTTAMLCAGQWARQQFSQADLGDRRRSKRLVQVATALAQSEGGTLPGAMGSWAPLKAAYRLLSCPEVTYEKIIRPHWELTARQCREPGLYLMIEDTTDLDFTGRQVGEMMGWTGDTRGRGLLLHSTLAVRVCGWDRQGEPQVQMAGLLGQRWWVRTHPTRNRRERRTDRLRRERESQRWAAVFDQLQPPPKAQWIYVADRESDIYEAMLDCVGAGIDFVVRSNQDRALMGCGGHIFQTVAAAEVLGRFCRNLRARPGAASRTVQLELRVARVALRPPYRPGHKLAPLTVNVVQAREVGALPAKDCLVWVLLTSLPCGDLAQGRKTVSFYAQRWLAEDYHKALKTGARMEQTQLATPERITALLGINAVVAVRLVQIKLLAKARPEEPVAQDLIGSEVLLILTANYGEPAGGWTNRELLVGIARLGGFLARKGDGLPGWQTIWRGWQRLIRMVEGFNLARGSERCG